MLAYRTSTVCPVMVFSVIQAFIEQSSISLTRSAHPTGKMDNSAGPAALLQS